MPSTTTHHASRTKLCMHPICGVVVPRIEINNCVQHGVNSGVGDDDDVDDDDKTEER